MMAWICDHEGRSEDGWGMEPLQQAACLHPCIVLIPLRKEGRGFPSWYDDAYPHWERELHLPSEGVLWPGLNDGNYVLYWQRKVDNLLE